MECFVRHVDRQAAGADGKPAFPIFLNNLVCRNLDYGIGVEKRCRMASEWLAKFNFLSLGPNGDVR